jgi:hypothetical protein
VNGDLVDLFTASPQGPTQPMGYRQGVIVAFDSVTGANTVTVGGVNLTDLPMLNTSEVLLMTPGAVVGIMVVGSTYAILGRLAIPNTADAGTALAAIATQSASVTTPETTASSSFGDLATTGPTLTNVSVGPSGRMLVMISCQAQADVPTGTGIKSSGCVMSFDLSGATTVGANEVNALHAFLAYSAGAATAPAFTLRASATRVALLTGLNPGLHTLVAKYRSFSSNTVTFSNRNLTSLAL